MIPHRTPATDLQVQPSFAIPASVPKESLSMTQVLTQTAANGDRDQSSVAKARQDYSRALPPDYAKAFHERNDARKKAADMAGLARRRQLEIDGEVRVLFWNENGQQPKCCLLTCIVPGIFKLLDHTRELQHLGLRVDSFVQFFDRRHQQWTDIAVEKVLQLPKDADRTVLLRSSEDVTDLRDFLVYLGVAHGGIKRPRSPDDEGALAALAPPPPADEKRSRQAASAASPCVSGSQAIDLSKVPSSKTPPGLFPLKQLRDMAPKMEHMLRLAAEASGTSLKDRFLQVFGYEMPSNKRQRYYECQSEWIVAPDNEKVAALTSDETWRSFARRMGARVAARRQGAPLPEPFPRPASAALPPPTEAEVIDVDANEADENVEQKPSSMSSATDAAVPSALTDAVPPYSDLDVYAAKSCEDDMTELVTGWLKNADDGALPVMLLKGVRQVIGLDHEQMQANRDMLEAAGVVDPVPLDVYSIQEPPWTGANILEVRRAERIQISRRKELYLLDVLEHGETTAYIGKTSFIPTAAPPASAEWNKMQGIHLWAEMCRLCVLHTSVAEFKHLAHTKGVIIHPFKFLETGLLRMVPTARSSAPSRPDIGDDAEVSYWIIQPRREEEIDAHRVDIIWDQRADSVDMVFLGFQGFIDPGTSEAVLFDWESYQ
ncbi:hypothetical protein GLOTRDRAFT_129261 [Gloeophyllum trabeum ATCC 11539]|uniref:Uncharacterized protein n=1 Tax=Gloeophyllum trabeum (strain ATCC 11539 / FP-39264 / Madison 617) TaxID=670483 RepID=S7Q977_GLOTA|nr:uncharacterized protein GLOTRDRAFT_129261 [Gloeophyllum trabeum ATCC 11539]EPQ56062.1 hypothetical protein GLOTRDRAFT_129261 [Gloeophyllum trabeum ATCC 11539]